MELLINLGYVALPAAFIILLITKLGWREWVQLHGHRLLSEMFGCVFCLSFWACLTVSILFCIFVSNDYLDLYLAILATPLTRALL
jgi:hypothetical protein